MKYKMIYKIYKCCENVKQEESSISTEDCKNYIDEIFTSEKKAKRTLLRLSILDLRSIYKIEAIKIFNTNIPTDTSVGIYNKSISKLIESNEIVDKYLIKLKADISGYKILIKSLRHIYPYPIEREVLAKTTVKQLKKKFKLAYKVGRILIREINKHN